MAIPLKLPASSRIDAVLMLLAGHDKTSPMDVQAYCHRSSNELLLALVDRSRKMLSITLALNAQRLKYVDAYNDITYDLKDRCRKLWFKLRIVVRCGWVKKGVHDVMENGPQTLVGKSWSNFKWYVRKFKGAGAKAPPR